MTETDATRKPLNMPVKFIPYLEKYRTYNFFKDMMEQLVLKLPNDHLKFMKIFCSKNIYTNKLMDRVILLISPEVKFDVKTTVRDIVKDLGYFVITRRCVMDRYEKHDEYKPGCVSPELMAKVAKTIVTKDAVVHAGWIMFDHPCTVREARCLQQEGVLPTVTLVLCPPPPQAPPADNPLTPARGFFTQDFEGLKYAYKATVKEVIIEPSDNIEQISTKCFNAIRAASTGQQNSRQGFHVLGNPAVYRVVIVGPSGSGRRTQAYHLAKHFGLVFINFDNLYREAMLKKDEVGERLRIYGLTDELKCEIVKRRLLQKDCIDFGYVLAGYPTCGVDFELLDSIPNTPNRVIILDADPETCKARRTGRAYDWCTGKEVPPGSTPNARLHPNDDEKKIDAELDYYYSEALAEIRAAAGINAAEVDARQPIDTVQTKIQAAVIAIPQFDIEPGFPIRHITRVD